MYATWHLTLQVMPSGKILVKVNNINKINTLMILDPRWLPSGHDLLAEELYAYIAFMNSWNYASCSSEVAVHTTVRLMYSIQPETGHD